VTATAYGVVAAPANGNAEATTMYMMTPVNDGGGGGGGDDEASRRPTHDPRKPSKV